jgi:hypothetical protein
MDTTNLMIGDWVHVNYINGYNTTNGDVIVTEVYEDKISAKEGKEKEKTTWAWDIVAPNEYVTPIPLTTEILEKNGFVENHINERFTLRYTLIYDGIGFSLKYVRSVFQWLGPLDFKYVHELQHALRLCGIKKEIQI